MMRLIRAQMTGYRNRAGAYGKRQSQRIKRISKDILQVDLFLDVAVSIMVLLALEHGPSIRNDDESAPNLHYGDGDSKEIQNVRANQKRSNQQYKAVYCHPAG